MTKKKEVAAKVIEPIEAPPITREEIDQMLQYILERIDHLNAKYIGELRAEFATFVSTPVIYERCERCHKKN